MLQLSHKKLDVYEITLVLIREIYTITKEFPDAEKFGLITQLRRASVSVCSNIAEGSSRKTNVEKRRFLEISRSSLVEIDTQIEIALMLDYISKENITELESCISRVFQMLSKMIVILDTKLTK
jgi:four helix bundle protein